MTFDIVEALIWTLFFICLFPVEYSYLKYVTLGDAWPMLKRSFLSWLGWSIVGAIAVLVIPDDDQSFMSPFTSAVPDIVWYFLWLAGITWILRPGIKLEFPKLTVSEWAFVNATAAFVVLSIALTKLNFPKPLLVAYVIAVWKLFGLYAVLVEKGKSNFETLNEFDDEQLSQ